MWWKFKPEGLHFVHWVAIEEFLTEEEVDRELARLDSVAQKMTPAELLLAFTRAGDHLKTMAGDAREKAFMQLRAMAGVRIFQARQDSSFLGDRLKRMIEEANEDLVQEFTRIESTRSKLG